MELVDSTAEWSCYRPLKEYSKGHLVFRFNDKNNLNYRRTTITCAAKYGKSMVDMGFARDYYMFTDIYEVNIAFRYDDSLEHSMYNFMSFINVKN